MLIITILNKKDSPGTGKSSVWVYAYELPTGPGGNGGDGGMRSCVSSLTKVLNIFKNANILHEKVCGTAFE
jgi:hypothetical protein